jgi:dTMP kinase
MAFPESLNARIVHPPNRGASGPSGFFLTFEGPEGSGKTTQIALLADSLRDEGFEVVRTREPGGVEVAEHLRELVLHEALQRETEALLFLAARAEHAHAVILPALERGAVVLCDRFTDSTLAYQGYGLGLDLETLRTMCRFAACGLEPDLTLLLDVPPELGLERRFAASQLDLHLDVPQDPEAAKTINKMENRELDFHRRVHAGFHKEAERAPERIYVVDATRPIKQVQQSIRRMVKKHLTPGPSPSAMERGD